MKLLPLAASLTLVMPLAGIASAAHTDAETAQPSPAVSTQATPEPSADATDNPTESSSPAPSPSETDTETIDYSVTVDGVKDSYEPGDIIELTAEFDPESEDVSWRWETHNPVEKDDEPAEDDWVVVDEQDTAEFESTANTNGQLIRAVATVDEEDYAAEPVEITVKEPEREVSITGLKKSYQPGDMVELELDAVPPLGEGDDIIWQWKMPDTEKWTELPSTGETNASFEAAEWFDGVEIRAQITIESSGEVLTTEPVTLSVPSDNPGEEEEGNGDGDKNDGSEGGGTESGDGEDATDADESDTGNAPESHESAGTDGSAPGASSETTGSDDVTAPGTTIGGTTESLTDQPLAAGDDASGSDDEGSSEDEEPELKTAEQHQAPKIEDSESRKKSPSQAGLVSTNDAGLPNTGVSTTVMVAVGIAILALGIGAIALWLRRKPAGGDQ